MTLTELLPNPALYVGEIWTPIFAEILAKWIPFAGSILVGIAAIKRLSAGR